MSKGRQRLDLVLSFAVAFGRKDEEILPSRTASCHVNGAGEFGRTYTPKQGEEPCNHQYGPKPKEFVVPNKWL